MIMPTDQMAKDKIGTVLEDNYGYAPEGLVDEIIDLFAGISFASYDEPLPILVRDSIWMTFPSKPTAEKATDQIFQALDR